MTQLDRRKVLKTIVATAGFTTLTTSASSSAEVQTHRKEQSNHMNLKIPSSLKAEHEELHEELVRTIRAGGKTGDAAREVANVLHPHFVKEEQLAMPPLGLLSELAAGRLPTDTAKIIAMTDKLKNDLPAMLKEHEAVVVGLDALAKAAQQENKPSALHFAEKLKLHAETEEQVLYPAAILVGEYIKLKLNKN